MIEDTLLLGAVTFTAFWLFRPAIRQSESWIATVTPLASIIGSGFLVVVPLLAHAVRGWAVVAMTAIVVLAYAIGGVIRFNIRYAEPVLRARGTPGLLLGIERFSDLSLGLAYLISVAFYVRLLASFVLRAAHMRYDLYANVITTMVLLFIGVVGIRRGLRGLERLEEYAVNVKLAIIAGLLLGLAWFDVPWVLDGEVAIEATPIQSWEQVLRMLAGILLVVQGFETSRYLGEAYDGELRVRTMRRAQIIAGIIYVVFVALTSPLLVAYDGTRDETAIIGISDQVAAILPTLLVVAAVMSQFSAAVADTAGGGGLISEFTRRRIGLYPSYLLVTMAAIVIVWSADIFQIIVLASRAFAFYYFMQCLVALVVSGNVRSHGRRGLWRAYLASMAVTMLLVVLFAISDP